MTMQSGRRLLRFETVDEAIAEAERLVAAERAGKLARRGNWTLGQALGHLATWNRFAYEGYPESVSKVPWVLRVLIRLVKGKMLREGLKPGVRIAGVEGGTLGTEPLSTEEGMRQFRETMERVKREEPVHPSPAFGKMTKAEWTQLSLRHAELHLGFQEVLP